MSVLKGDYIGFSYGINPKTGKPMHSSDLGIVRTSNGSRFDENLLPTMQDKTVPVSGGDGTYYFGSYYTQRQFSVSFAFDSLTEEQVATLKSHFGDKKIQDLIFDERPYKIYRAKVTGSATLKYIPFSEGATNRLYKGEGTLQFTCYEPFARCAFTNKTYNELKTQYTNIDEWWDASKIEQGGNFGDIEVPFTVKTSGVGQVVLSTGTVSWNIPSNINTEIILNTKIGLALDESGRIYNEYFSGNTTLKIPVGASAEETANLIYTPCYF